MPEIFCEDEIDFEKFKQLFAKEITTNSDRYMLNWAGKSEAYQTLQTPTTKTLTPCVEESVDFEQTQNIFIEGENLDVLKALQKSYFNAIKMIYIDPPYNTGNDFVYNDNFADTQNAYKDKVGERGEDGNIKCVPYYRNTKENGHYHSNWLNMMLPRLHLARNLLTDDGVIFISIDDNEQAQLKLLCDEVFGEENFLGQISRATGTTTGQGAKDIGSSLDYLFIYRKSEEFHLNGIKLSEEDEKRFSEEDENGKYSYLQLRKTGNADRREDRPLMYYPVISPKGEEIYPIGPTGYESRWRVGFETYKKLVEDKMIIWKESRNGSLQPYVKYYLDGRTKQVSNLWNDLEGNKKGSIELKELLGSKNLFDNPKPTQLLKRCIEISTNKDDLILDFFSGSGTTAHAIMAFNTEDNGNRPFICVQLPEQTDEKSEAFKAGYKNIAEISKERIRRAGQQILQNADQNQPLDVGFKVFKLTESHFKQWRSPTAENLESQIELFIDSVGEKADTQAMLYEILLRLGLKLTAKVRAENNVFWVEDDNGQLFALMLAEINDAMIESVIAKQPKKVVTLDRLFNGNDAQKKNAELQMKDADIAFFVI